jgi:hypothetical protein
LSFHKTRMKLLLDTWISTRKNQVSRCIWYIKSWHRSEQGNWHELFLQPYV